MSPTPTQTTGAKQTELFLELYDHLMAEIEPELMSFSIPCLADYYKDETPEEKSEREERYARAFDELIRRVRMLRDIHERDSGEFVQFLQNMFTNKAQKDDTNNLHSAEQNIDSL